MPISAVVEPPLARTKHRRSATSAVGPRIGAGLAIAAAAAWYVSGRVSDLNRSVRVFATTGPVWWCLAAAAAAALIASSGGVLRHSLRSTGVDVTFRRATRLALAAHTIGTFLPTAGLSAMPLLANESRRTIGQGSAGPAGLMVAATVSRVALGFAGLLAVPFAPTIGISSALALTLLAAYVTCTLIRVWLLCVAGRDGGRVGRLEQRVRDQLQRRGGIAESQSSSTIASALREAWTNHRTLTPAFGWSLFGKLAGGTLIVVVAHAVGATVSPGFGLAVYVAAVVAGSLSLLPAGLGVVDLTIAHAFQRSGLPLTDAVGAVLMYRLFQLWLPLTLGGLALIGLSKQTRPPRTSGPRGASRSTPRAVVDGSPTRPAMLLERDAA